MFLQLSRESCPPRSPQDGPRWPQGGTKKAQDGPKMAPRRPKMAPRWPQDGPKMAPRRPQDGPKMAQDGGKRPQDTQLSRKYVDMSKNLGFPLAVCTFSLYRGFSHFLLIVGRPGAVLRPSWSVFGPSWGHLGPSWGRLGAILGPKIGLTPRKKNCNF